MKALLKENHQKFLDLFPEEFRNADLVEQQTSIKIYQLLSRKIHPNQKLLAKELSLSEPQIQGALEKMANWLYWEDGNIVGFAGLTTRKMNHHFTVDGITTYTWCALDAIFIPELLGKTAIVKSRDPVSKKNIEFTVTPSQLSDSGDQGVMVSLVTPSHELIRKDVISNFCHFVFFFESLETGDKWSKDHPNTFLVTLEESVKIAHHLNQERYPDLLVDNI